MVQQFEDLAGLGAVVEKIPHIETILWDSTLAAGGELAKPRHVKKALPFIVQAVVFQATLAVAVSNVPIGTPLPRGPIPVDLALAPLSLVQLKYEFDGVTFGSGDFMSALLCTGTAELPYIPPVTYRLKAQSHFVITLKNNTAVGIKGELQFHGYYAKTRQN